jgi:D-3-phosphoglycerate dehydrogenase
MKVLTSPSSFGQVGAAPVNLLVENGFDVINNPYGRKLPKMKLLSLQRIVWVS